MSQYFKYVSMNFLIKSQAFLFSVLFAVWALPGTILVRNICLAIGALIGFYQIYAYRSFFTKKSSISVWLLISLFLWMIFHLLFLSTNFEMQYAEFQSIWKRVLMGFIFALGLGLGLVNAPAKLSRSTWVIFYLGLCLPTLIYILKFGLLYYEKSAGLELFDYWHIYIAKTAYMGFCFPLLAVALGQIYIQAKQNHWFNGLSLLYLLAIPAVLFVFYAENIKNGMVYAIALILLFVGLLAYRSLRVSPIRISLLSVLIVLISGFFIVGNIKENRSWNTLIADAKIAIQTEHYQNWKCGPLLGYPKNELGETVSITNYERIAWGISASKLVLEYPLGYGLIERSFRQHGNALWPGSCLSQSHSGWLDLTLGIGIPGMLLLLGSIFFALKGLLGLNLAQFQYLGEWRAMSIWILIGFILIWCTTEISQKVFFDELIFFIALSGGLLGINISNIHSNFFDSP